MPLPIVLGGKSISAQTLPGPCGRPEETDDGVALEPVTLYQTLGWGICPLQEWQVRVTCNYYDLVRADNGQRDCTMVEVRIQLAPLARPFSPDYRETAHHLRLFDGAQDKYPQSQPQVVVSSDRRNLAVLLFDPHQQSSALVMFQLRRPRSDLSVALNANPIPLPSYIQKVGNDDSNAASMLTRDPPAVATHPRFVSVWGICTLCRIPNVSPSVFLAACQDGSLVWLDARSSMAVASGMLTTQEPEMLPFVRLSVSPTSVMNKGRLLIVTANGKAILANWNLESKTKVQKTFLKRASTGTVVMQASLEESPTKQLEKLVEQQQERAKEKKRMAPQRSKSDQPLPIPTQLHALLSPMLNRKASDASGSSLSSSKSNPLKNLERRFNFSTPKRSSSHNALRKTKRLDEFAIKELQKDGKDPQAPLETQFKLKQRRRRRSELTKSSDANGGATVDNLRRHMSLEVTSVRGGKQSGNFVVDAIFTRLPTLLCLLYRPDALHQTMAEIFSVSSRSDLEAVVPLSLNSEQIEQAFEVRASEHSDLNTAISTQEAEQSSLSSRLGLAYDPRADALAMSTMDGQGKRWLGCLWSWRNNTVGWTIQSSAAGSALWSRLYFAEHPQQGSTVVFLETHQEKYVKTRKQTAPLGLLSPSFDADPSLEPNCLLLSNDSVRFPGIDQQSKSSIIELEWKVASLPLTYRNAYGPPRIAAWCQQNGSCISVASSSGVCILDSFFKWKQFGTPSEERSFQVIAMSWWEGQNANGGQEELETDFLVALIQSNNGRRYLSCWSPNRLDLAHQLLKVQNIEPKEGGDAATESAWGISLPREMKATSLSLIAEPFSGKGPRRAVVAVSAAHCRTCEMSYALYRLQVSRLQSASSVEADSYQNLQPYHIVVQESLQGTLRAGSRSVGPVSYSFLAAASFDFDLGNEEYSEDTAGKSMIATFGVVRSPGGIEAVSLCEDNKTLTAELDGHEVARVRLSDIVSNSEAQEASTKRYLMDAFVWTIGFINGQNYCWTVPYRMPGPKGSFQIRPFLDEERGRRPKGLNPPTLVGTKIAVRKQEQFMMGTKCYIGNSTDWMQQSSPGTQSDAALGQVPESAFGCILRSGQHVRKLLRGRVGDFDTDLFASDFLDTEIYGPSDFIMMPPVFVPSLYMHLLEAASLRCDYTLLESEDAQGRLLSIVNHIDSRIKVSKNMDAVFMALRLLILRSVELLSDVDKKHKKQHSDGTKANLVLSMALFHEIVDVVRRCTSNLQFASFFLEVGRQIEPSCLTYLFPLPHAVRELSSGGGLSQQRRRSTTRLNRLNARSVEELFSLCIQEGALATSASALPLLGGRDRPRQYCKFVLSKAIEIFVQNMDSAEISFDFSQEERRVIEDVFRFGMKLEDAAEYEETNGGRLYDHPEDDDDAQATLSSSGDTFATDETEGYIQTNRRSLICGGGHSRRGSSILNFMIPSIFDGGRNSATENAIRKAATSFIDSKTDLASQDFLNLSLDDENLSESETNSESDDININGDMVEATFMPDEISSDEIFTVSAVVGTALLELLQAPKIDQPWKAIAGLARLIIHQSKEFPAVATFASVADRTKLADLENVLPLGYDQGDQRLQHFFVAEIGRCRFQIGREQCAWIVDLVLVLLDRLRKTEALEARSMNRSNVQSALIVLGLVAGHVSDRAMDLLGHCTEASKLVEMYRIVQVDARGV